MSPHSLFSNKTNTVIEIPTLGNDSLLWKMDEVKLSSAQLDTLKHLNTVQLVKCFRFQIHQIPENYVFDVLIGLNMICSHEEQDWRKGKKQTCDLHPCFYLSLFCM